MTRPDEIEARPVPQAGQEEGRLQSNSRMKNVPSVARSRLLRVVGPVRAALAPLGPLGAALWALYPVAIMLLIIGFLFAGDGST